MGQPQFGAHRENPPSILLVEDNLINQKVALVLLERLGLHATVANNGKEGVTAFCQGNYSLILMDCHMPEMDGFEATVAIRKIEAQADSYTPIIAVTAMTMTGDRERCIASGMDDYIAKPINLDLLKQKINHWLRSDVVYKSARNSRRYLRADSPLTLIDSAPINMRELSDFYGDELSAIIALFDESTEKSLNSLAAHIKDRNSKEIGSLAHELKSAASSIGAKKLASFALYLEQAAGQEDWLEAEETLASLKRAFDNLREHVVSTTWSKLPSQP